MRYLAARRGQMTLPKIDSCPNLQVNPYVCKNENFLLSCDDSVSPFCSAVIKVMGHKKCQSQIDWLVDGVVVCSTLLPWDLTHKFLGMKIDATLGVRIAAPTQLVDLDLSQFRLRREAELTVTLIELVKPEVQKLVQQILQQLKQFHYIPMARQPAKWSATAQLFAGGSFGVMACLELGVAAVGPLGGLSAFLAGRVRFYWQTPIGRISCFSAEFTINNNFFLIC